MTKEELALIKFKIAVTTENANAKFIILDLYGSVVSCENLPVWNGYRWKISGRNVWHHTLTYPYFINRLSDSLIEL